MFCAATHRPHFAELAEAASQRLCASWSVSRNQTAAHKAAFTPRAPGAPAPSVTSNARSPTKHFAMVQRRGSDAL
jgi:hypothetical protein